MAKVFFEGVKIPYSELKGFVDDVNFKQFVIQFVSIDSDRWKDRYTIIALPVDIHGNNLKGEKIEFDVVDSKAERSKDRVEIGNLYLTKRLIELLDPKPEDDLYFMPKQYNFYMGYVVSTSRYRVKISVDTVDELFLKPSPPAPPEP